MDSSAHPERFYAYKEFSTANALRLLRLEPSADTQADLICELIEVDSSRPSIHDDTGWNGYEALSWCWGTAGADTEISMRDEEHLYRFKITPNLKSALMALRRPDSNRYLWIDAVCIDQSNTKERNEQIPKMDVIYFQAKNVCIWLGEGDETTHRAIEFIKHRVLSLWEFDTLWENTTESTNWTALISLMKQPWFYRRWVVQEIALSKRGTIHCGKDEISWQDFADAVSLVVEVESATHRLSDVMKSDRKFGHTPEFFGHVKSLGAALLVEATNNLFRKGKTGVREPQYSLEYLVCELSSFRTTQPHDTIYALLALAKDANRRNEDQDAQTEMTKKVLRSWSAIPNTCEVYHIDYTLGVVDVYQEFISFAIRKSEKTRALDIICRPWAPPIADSTDARWTTQTLLQVPGAIGEQNYVGEMALPSWICDLNSAAFTMGTHIRAGMRMQRKNADPLVGKADHTQRNYSATGAVPLGTCSFKKRPSYYELSVDGFILDEIEARGEKAHRGDIPERWLDLAQWNDMSKDPPDEFWRTMVADRGTNGLNPPTYYPRACKESIEKLLTGNMATKDLINEGRCTIVAEFLRRVQAVIWNQRLVRTQRLGRLGLVPETARKGFKICILYGCSVPVVLQRIDKTRSELESEQICDKKEKNVRVKQETQQIWKRLRRKLEAKKEMQGLEENLAELPTVTSYIKPCVGVLTLLATGILLMRFWHAQPAKITMLASSLLLLTPPEEQRPGKGFRRYFKFLIDIIKVKVRVFVLFHVWHLTILEVWQIFKNSEGKESVELALLMLVIATGLILWLALHAESLAKARLFLKNIVWPAHLLTKTYAEVDGHRELSSSHHGSNAQSSEFLQTDPGLQHDHLSVPRASAAHIGTSDHYWKLVGACYVYGMMNGEAIAYQRANNIKAQTFALR